MVSHGMGGKGRILEQILEQIPRVDREGFGICCSCSVGMGISAFQDTKLSLKAKGLWSGGGSRLGFGICGLGWGNFLGASKGWEQSSGEFPPDSADFPSRCQGRDKGTPQLGN